MAAAEGNKYALGNTGGRPPLYETPEELTQAVEKYFVYVKGEFHIEEVETKVKGKIKKVKQKVWDRDPEPITITGLTLFLGFADRQSLYDYQEKQEFSGIIKNARTRVEHAYEKALAYDKPTGAIFALKNMGWVDKKESTVTHKFGVEADEEYVD